MVLFASAGTLVGTAYKQSFEKIVSFVIFLSKVVQARHLQATRHALRSQGVGCSVHTLCFCNMAFGVSMLSLVWSFYFDNFLSACNIILRYSARSGDKLAFEAEEMVLKVSNISQKPELRFSKLLPLLTPTTHWQEQVQMEKFYTATSFTLPRQSGFGGRAPCKGGDVLI